MHGRMMFLRAGGHLPLPDNERPERPLEVVVPYTGAALAAQALEAAIELARGVEAEVTLMAVHVLPYPAPLECQEGIRRHLEAELATATRTSPVSIRIKLVFARDRADAYLGLLKRHALVVIAAKDRWWRTREESLARRLTSSGHSVALIKVK